MLNPLYTQVRYHSFLFLLDDDPRDPVAHGSNLLATISSSNWKEDISIDIGFCQKRREARTEDQAYAIWS